jgi:hypothetical protein
VQVQVRRRVLAWLARHGFLADATIAEMLAWRLGDFLTRRLRYF